MSDTPIDNLVRALVAPDAATLRAEPSGAAGRTLSGYFAVFNRWTEIDSSWEGRFLERIAPAAFDAVFADKRDQIKVLYDHGHDPQLGNKPLGTITDLRADKVGAYYEVDLIRASYNDDFVIPAAQAGLLGASFRFKVGDEEWTEPSSKSAHNPRMLPERTITQVDPLYEFGPVTFPAYPDGTKAGVRSLTDDHLDRLLHDPLFLARFTERAGLAVVERLLEKLPPSAEQTDDHAPPPPERSHEEQHEDEDDERPTASEYIPTPRPRMSLESLREQRAVIECLVAAATRSET